MKSATPPLRVLVVDDLRDSADSMALLMGLLGHETRVAYDGPTALEIARQFRPQAVLLDIGLPGLNGYEVADRLRETEECAAALLVAVTGYGQEQDRQRARLAGFDAHLLKPANLVELQALLDAEASRRAVGG